MIGENILGVVESPHLFSPPVHIAPLLHCLAEIVLPIYLL